MALRADGARLEPDIRKAAEKAGDAGAKTLSQRLGAGIKKHAEKIVVGAGAAVGAFVAGSVREFARFQEQMNEVFTLLPGITREAMDKMSEDVKAFSRETGKLPDEVIPALYQAISAGVPEDNVFEFLRVANKAAVAGVATTTDSVNLLAAVTKGYGDTSQEAVKKVADLAFQTVKLGQTTYPELAAAIGQVVPLAAALGVKQEELFGITATLTGVTGDTNAVMTQQRAVLTALTKQTPEMSAAIKKLGFETSLSAIETLGLTGTLDALVGTTDGTTEALTGLFGRAEAITAVLALTGSQADVARQKISAMGEATGSVDTAFETMESGIAAQTRKILASIKTFAIDVGAQFEGFGPLLLLFGPSVGRAIGAMLGAGFGLVTTTLLPKLITALGAAMSSSLAETAAFSIRYAIAAAGESPLVAAAATKAGQLAGTKFGLALGAAAAAAIPAAVVGIVDTLRFELTKTGIDEAIAEGLSKRTLAGVREYREGIVRQLDQSRGDPLLGGFVRDLERQLELADAEIARKLASFDTGQSHNVVENVVEPLTDAVAGSGPALARAFLATADQVRRAIKDMGRSIPGAFAAGILAEQDVVGQAMTALRLQMEQERTPTKQAGFVLGALISEELAKGIVSKRRGVKAVAENTRDIAEEELAEFISDGGKIGKKAMDALNAAIKSKDRDVRRQAKRTKRIIETGTVPDTHKVGLDAGKNYADGLDDSQFIVTAAAARLTAAVVKKLGAGLHSFDEIFNAYGSTIPGRAAGGPVMAGQAYVVGEHRPELFVPSVSGHIVPDAKAAGAGGNTFHITVNPGSDVSPLAARRFGQQVLDEVAAGLRSQSSRFARAGG